LQHTAQLQDQAREESELFCREAEQYAYLLLEHAAASITQMKSRAQKALLLLEEEMQESIEEKGLENESQELSEAHQDYFQKQLSEVSKPQNPVTNNQREMKLAA
jgi:hypothetical protein